jgi:hypothetical protein
MRNVYITRLVLYGILYPIFTYGMLEAHKRHSMNDVVILIFSILFVGATVLGIIQSIKYLRNIKRDKEFSQTIEKSRTWKN